jgi:amino acid transporter
MLKVPFLGNSINKIMPLFILIFGGIFAVFSLFKLKSKTLTALKQFTKKNLTEDGVTEKAKLDGKALFTDKNAEVK